MIGSAPVLGGRRARWFWTDAKQRIRERPLEARQLPAGVIIDHGDHTVVVPWVPLAGLEAFELDSLMPLTVIGEVTCALCGASGRIVEGTWLPAEVAS